MANLVLGSSHAEEGFIPDSNELNMSVIAEGVETKEELSILRDLKCNVIQGFIFDKPLSV